MSFPEFMRADYQEGYQYELIDGELYVFPMPSLPENRVESWIGLIRSARLFAFIAARGRDGGFFSPLSAKFTRPSYCLASP
jgi:hypothetical protein